MKQNEQLMHKYASNAAFILLAMSVLGSYTHADESLDAGGAVICGRGEQSGQKSGECDDYLEKYVEAGDDEKCKKGKKKRLKFLKKAPNANAYMDVIYSINDQFGCTSYEDFRSPIAQESLRGQRLKQARKIQLQQKQHQEELEHAGLQQEDKKKEKILLLK